MKYALVVASMFCVAILVAQSGTSHMRLPRTRSSGGRPRPLSHPAHRSLFWKAILRQLRRLHHPLQDAEWLQGRSALAPKRENVTVWQELSRWEWATRLMQAR